MRYNCGLLNSKVKHSLVTLLCLLILTKLHAQWTQYTYITNLGLSSTNFYVCIPDGNGWIAVGGDNGWIVNRTNAGTISASNTIYNPIKTISFINDSVAIAFSSKIFTSTIDTGANWSSQLNMTTGAGVNDVEFVSHVGYACGNSGTIRKYTSTGNYPGWIDWQTQTLDAAVTFNAVEVVTTINAFTCGSGGKLYRTSDGSNWSALASGTTTNLNNISFKDAQNGVVIGDNGFIATTTDGGDNWNTLPQYTTTKLNSVQYLSNGTIYIVGDGGLILKSLDNGTTWGTQNSGTLNNLNSICMLGSTAFIAGNQGTLIYTTNSGGTVTPISPIATSTVSRIYETDIKIFPNPVSIYFNVEAPSNYYPIHTEIYNSSGILTKELLLNEPSTKISLTDLEQGLYFIRVLKDGNTLYNKTLIKE